ncbi:MAG: hypothetical protein WBN93_11900, partial [Acidimicrobiia bacterium]
VVAVVVEAAVEVVADSDGLVEAAVVEDGTTGAVVSTPESATGGAQPTTTNTVASDHHTRMCSLHRQCHPYVSTGQGST